MLYLARLFLYSLLNKVPGPTECMNTGQALYGLSEVTDDWGPSYVVQHFELPDAAMEDGPDPEEHSGER